MELNEMTIIVPNTLMERLDKLEYKLDQLLANKGTKLIDNEEYVNEEQAAKMLNIKRSTLSNWKSQNRIDYYKAEWSNKSFFKMEDIIKIKTAIKHSGDKEVENKAKSYILKTKKKK